MKDFSAISVVMLMLLSIVACEPGDGPDLLISEIEITRPIPGAAMSAGYFLLQNRSGRPIEITRIESAQFERVEIHETVIENDISRMRRLPGLNVPAGGEVRLARGSKHLMLMRPTETLDRISLDFYSGDRLVLSTESTIADR